MLKKIIAVLSCFILMMSVIGCGTNSSAPTTTTVTDTDASAVQADSKIVIATTYSVYDWAKNVIKDNNGIELKYLVDSNVDLHSYQPSASDIVEYQNADLVLCIGGESEEWIEDLDLDENKVISLINSVNAKEEELVERMQGEEEESEEEPEYDEHIWLSLNNAKACVATIADKFASLDSANAFAYKTNANNYISSLDKLDKEYESVVNSATTTTLLFGDRFPFRYMVDDYGLNYYAAFIGCSAETEASFETIAFLAEKVDELGLNTVCTISSNHDIANSIISATENKNAEIVEFNSMQSISNKEADNVSYIDIMTSNLESLKKSLGE